MYLTQNHFKKSVMIAVSLHLLLLIAYTVNSQITQTKILQKPILVKLGKVPNASKGRSDNNREMLKNIPRPVIKSPITQPKEIIPTPLSMQPSRIKSLATPQIQSTETIKTKKPEPAKIEKIKDKPKQAKIIPKPRSKPVLPPPLVQNFNTKSMTKNPPPSQVSHNEIPFVQNMKSKKDEVEGISGHELGNRSQAEQAAITKYEQKLALWLQKHHVYPISARKAGIEGDAVVRMQIDRLGNIRFYELAEDSGHNILDEAVLSMIARSDPVPPVPDTYPGDFVIEFLIPINFKIR